VFKDVCESFESLELPVVVGEVVVPVEAAAGDESLSSGQMLTTAMATKALTRALARMTMSVLRKRIAISL
jgi:D-aminopeptidase